MTAMLSVEGLHAGYGRSSVLRGIDLHLDEGEAIGLLGPNGHGKTTLLRCVSGLHRPTAGDIRFQGASLLPLSPRAVLRRGVVQVPQGSRLFPRMTVADCLRLGGAANPDRSARRPLLDEVFGLFPKLQQRSAQLAGTLSGGERQMLSIGIGLMAGPRVLILDEPTLGLAPKVKHELADAIRQLRGRLEALVLVDGDMDLVLRATDRFYVVESGQVVQTGDSVAGADSARMMSLFLGDV
ncbi:ABC transporter ATP-binding protein [Nakamurella endophytica]|uniref:ABC transporter ATP-binding protein n=1 Tax=Nakamurella endophytica TaxID=1748367 RepID=A0A917WFJ4_9ACTN|nr:ABC transporter ATP-binding protein [Nakamurella endophytica]GGL99054.1 ABC transporter ATP-binding protein [Nakamurella endophytica]